MDSSKIAGGQVVKSLNGLTNAVSLTQGANVTINTVGNSLQISAPAGGLALPYSGTASSSGSIFTLTNSGSGPAGVFLGNIGIGTPQVMLDVNGSLRWGGTTTNYGYSGEDGGGLFLEQVGGSAATSKIRLQTSKSGNLTDYSQSIIDPTNGFSFMKIGTGNGNVGIGTANPTRKLEVTGDMLVRARSIDGIHLSCRTLPGTKSSGYLSRAGSHMDSKCTATLTRAQEELPGEHFPTGVSSRTCERMNPV